MFLLSYKRIKRLKAILWCGVVACKDNDKVVECGSGVTGRVGCDVDRLVVVVFVFVVAGLGIDRTSPCALPQTKPPTL